VSTFCPELGGVLTVTDFYTIDSFLDPQAIIAWVILIPTVLATLIDTPGFHRLKKWISFIAAIAFSLIGASMAEETSGWKWLIAILNAFLIYASAYGITLGADRAAETAAQKDGHGGQQYSGIESRGTEARLRRAVADWYGPPPPYPS
jgi:hypothetical protein